jgi:hypothetical protein
VPEKKTPGDRPQKPLPRHEQLPNERIANREQWSEKSVKHERPSEHGVSDTKAPPPKK